MKLTRRQYATKSAFRIDPLLARQVELVEFTRSPEHVEEVPADDLWRHRRRDPKTRITTWIPLALIVGAVIIAMPTKHTTTVVADTDPCPTLSYGATGQGVT